MANIYSSNRGVFPTMAKISVSNSAVNTTLTASSTIDKAEILEVNQTTSNITLTLPSPTFTMADRRLIIANVGSAGFTVVHSTYTNTYIAPNTSVEFVWVCGLAWFTNTSKSLAYGSYHLNATTGTTTLNNNWAIVQGSANNSIANNITIASGVARMTILQSGIYRISAIAGIPTSASTWIQNAIYKNGSGFFYGTRVYSQGGYAQTCACEVIVQLTAGDIMEMWAYAGASGSCNAGSFTIEQKS